MTGRDYKQDITEVGQIIRWYRKKRKLSQEQLAEKADTSVNTIHRIESGTHKVPMETVLAIADVLNVPIEKLCPERYANIKQAEEMKKVEFLFGRLTKDNQKVVMETIMPLMKILLQQQNA